MLDHRKPFAVLLALSCLVGCASQDIPQAFRGRMFGRTGPLAFYSGQTGFMGPVLNAGTYFTGTYNELRMIECATVTKREPLTALTKDGVQFGLDIFVRFSADCADESVKKLLTRVVPDREGVVSANALYEIYVRPSVGAAVREVVSPYRANDINEKREEVLDRIRKRFVDMMVARERDVVSIYEVNLSNLDFPDAMDAANVDRAVQGVLKDKAIAERERVQAEIETATMRRELADREGQVAAVRILRVGEALRKYPEYLQYDLQDHLPGIYRDAGANGNLVIAAPSPTILVTPGAHPSPPRPAPPVKATPERPAGP